MRRAGRKIVAFKKQHPNYETSEEESRALANLELDLLYIKVSGPVSNTAKFHIRIRPTTEALIVFILVSISQSKKNISPSTQNPLSRMRSRSRHRRKSEKRLRKRWPAERSKVRRDRIPTTKTQMRSQRPLSESTQQATGATTTTMATTRTITKITTTRMRMRVKPSPRPRSRKRNK